MTYDPAKHHRKSIRLRGFDYTRPGNYFVTICVKNRENLFGETVGGVMRLNGLGMIVQSEWLRTAEIRREISLDAFVVMPNHFHGIVGIRDVDDGAPDIDMDTDDAGADGNPPLQHMPQRMPRSLGSIIAGFKSATTKRINIKRGTPGLPVWQRNYHDRIIRNADSLIRIRNYIAENPAHWERDMENPTFFL